MIERAKKTDEVAETGRDVSPKKVAGDTGMDVSLRPSALDEYVGQDAVKRNLSVLMEAARVRGEALEHVLFYGPPGLGKTTLANIVAREMNVNIRVTSGPALERSGDVASILTNLQDHDVLFIDEIHRLKRTVEETLYPAMEDYFLDLVIGKGPGARTMRLDLPRFTIIGATTQAGLLSSPLRDRFGSLYRLEFYTEADIEAILKRSARLLDVDLDELACREIALRSRQTPRVANRLLKRVRDLAQVEGDGVLTAEIAERTFEMLGVDAEGLDEVDRRVIRTVIEKFDGGPCGLRSIAASTAEDAGTIEEVVEPYLVQRGFLARTSRGRMATRKAYEHLGLPYSDGGA